MPIHGETSDEQCRTGGHVGSSPVTAGFQRSGLDRNTPRIEYPYVRSVYALYDAEHKAEHVHLFGEGHDYGYSKRSAVYPFFAHHLGLPYKRIPYDNGFDESFVTVLSPMSFMCLMTPIRDLRTPCKDKAVMAALGFE